MVELRFLSGRHQNTSCVVRRFPCTIGRSLAADVQIEEPGVWNRHCELRFSAARGFILKTLPDALAFVNGEMRETAVLRNGDRIQIGVSQFQFWLSQVRQRSLRPRELLTWIALGLLCAGQIALIYALLR